MNDEPEWTPTRGILTALRVLGLRLSFGFVAYTAIMYFAWSLIQQLPLLALLVGVVGMAGALLGLPMGLLAAKRLCRPFVDGDSRRLYYRHVHGQLSPGRCLKG